MNLVPRYAEESKAILAEAKTLRYRLRRHWAKLLNRSIPPSWQHIETHMWHFGVAPGFILTTDEWASRAPGGDFVK